MQKWEYRIFASHLDPAELVVIMNESGAEGWELAAVVAVTDYQPLDLIQLHRRIREVRAVEQVVDLRPEFQVCFLVDCEDFLGCQVELRQYRTVKRVAPEIADAARRRYCEGGRVEEVTLVGGLQEGVAA